MTSYCHYCRTHPEDTLHKTYHDTQYGFPLSDDNALFARLVLEINQAGLSWTTILKKSAHFHAAYHDFNIETVAHYDENDRARLMANAGIVRNRLKINAAIVNAQRILLLQAQHGSFKNWLDQQRGLDRAAWTKLFKQTFLFTGGEITHEFLLSTGYLAGAHDVDCPIYAQLA